MSEQVGTTEKDLEIERLERIIKNLKSTINEAPHDEHCGSKLWDRVDGQLVFNPCDCWKAQASSL
jgi:hypothetical protein